MSQPTNNQEKWIDKLTNLVEKEAYCLQGKDCYMNEIIDLVCQEIRRAKIEGMIEIQNILLNREDDDFVKVTAQIINAISNLKNNDNTTKN